MSSPQSEHQALIPPQIRIHSASPEASGNIFEPTESPDALEGTSIPRRTKSCPAANKKRQGQQQQQDIKRSATTAGFKDSERSRGMAPSASRRSPDSPARKEGESSNKKTRATSMDVDWTEVTDPEERRRIQNRIAQRKFREKARDNKERSERDSRNQENAGNSYRIPLPRDIDSHADLSGLPWGCVSLSHVVSLGHDAESRRSSGPGYVGDEMPSAGYHPQAYGQGFPQTASYGSSGAEDAFYDDGSYVYDPTLVPPFPSR